MKILVLDFDGVLHGHNGPSFIYLDRLDAVFAAHPDTQIVISSSWQDTHPLEKLRGLLQQHGHRVAGTFKSLIPSYRNAGTRQDAALAVVKILGATSWVLIDDDCTAVLGYAPAFEEDLAHVVLCNPLKGLATPGVIDAINERLSK